jgi:hypothetical protein
MSGADGAERRLGCPASCGRSVGAGEVVSTTSVPSDSRRHQDTAVEELLTGRENQNATVSVGSWRPGGTALADRWLLDADAVKGRSASAECQWAWV